MCPNRKFVIEKFPDLFVMVDGGIQHNITQSVVWRTKFNVGISLVTGSILPYTGPIPLQTKLVVGLDEL